MPIYEYKCRVCDEHFEVEQAFTDETLTEIDGCSIDESGRHPVKKVFAAPAITFKGDGFYRNDARSPGGAPATSSTSEASPSDTSPDSTSTSDSSTGRSSESSAPSSGSDKAATSSPTPAGSSSD